MARVPALSRRQGRGNAGACRRDVSPPAVARGSGSSGASHKVAPHFARRDSVDGLAFWAVMWNSEVCTSRSSESGRPTPREKTDPGFHCFSVNFVGRSKFFFPRAFITDGVKVKPKLFVSSRYRAVPKHASSFPTPSGSAAGFNRTSPTKSGDLSLSLSAL